MAARAYSFDGAVRDQGDGSWHRNVIVNGWRYTCGVEKGKRVRIRFKPQGQNVGNEWWGIVRDQACRVVWSGKVGRTLGVRGLLIRAGLLCPDEPIAPETLHA